MLDKRETNKGSKLQKRHISQDPAVEQGPKKQDKRVKRKKCNEKKKLPARRKEWDGK